MDIELFRNKPDVIRESQKRRFPITKDSTKEEIAAHEENVGLVDVVIENDNEWRKARSRLDTLNKLKGICSKANGEKIKNKEVQKEETEEQIQLYKELEDDVDKITKELAQKLTCNQLAALSKVVAKHQETTMAVEKEKIETRDYKAGLVGNLVFVEVPVSNNEDNNLVIKTVGDKIPVKIDGKKYFHEKEGFQLLNHVDIMLNLGGMDTKRGSVMAGERGYYLKGDLFLLNMALTQYAMSFLAIKKGFTPIYPPFFLRKEVMSEVAQLQQFDEELYKVTGDGEDKYLIATSEQPIASYHRKERLDDSELPIKYAGYSTCFRKEAGTHGRDTTGIFRVHQFDKIEQFYITSPKVNEKTGKLFSEEAFVELMDNCEEFYQSLGLPYQVISIVSGKLNNAAAIKYDLEAWFPGSQTYRELVSCSNCTSYQSRKLDIKYGKNSLKSQNIKAEYVHMLNCTMCATTRCLCCIVENHQTKDGIKIPEVLQPFMGGKTELKFQVVEEKKKSK